MVENTTVPGSYLYSAFVVQLGCNESDVWIADSGVSCHMTYDRIKLYVLGPLLHGCKTIAIGHRRKLKAVCVGNMEVIFHSFVDKRIPLIDDSYVPGVWFQLYSLYTVQKTNLSLGRFRNAHYRQKCDVHPKQ